MSTYPLMHPAATYAGDHAGKLAGKLVKEGERGAVLLGAARIDQALESLLKRTLLPNVGGDDNLFDPDRPLGTFSSKIALTYRLGLIDKSVEHALQMIRKIRNEFAHSFEEALLSDHTHRNRLNKPYAEARKTELWTKLNEHLATHASNVKVEVREYICLVTILVGFIEAVAHMQEVNSPLMQVCLPQGVRASGKLAKT